MLLPSVLKPLMWMIHEQVAESNLNCAKYLETHIFSLGMSSVDPNLLFSQTKPNEVLRYLSHIAFHMPGHDAAVHQMPVA